MEGRSKVFRQKYSGLYALPTSLLSAYHLTREGLCHWEEAKVGYSDVEVKRVTVSVYLRKTQNQKETEACP